MRPAGTRLVRRALVAVALVVTGAVAWNLRPTGKPGPPANPPAGGEGTSIGDVSFFRFHGGEQRLQVEAKAWAGEEDGVARLQGVKVSFPFVARGEEATAVVTADECLYDSSRESARFRGNVRVVTDDGFELETDSLDYQGARGRIASDDEVRFRRGRASGSARGLLYRSRADEIELKADVRLRFEDGAGGPATEVQAQRARGSRQTRMIRFQGDVLVEEGGRELRSNRLQVTLDPELESIVRVAAIGSVDARLAGSGTLAGGQTGGERRLQCRRLDLDFRGPGVLEEALAVQHATLELHPGPGDPPERRRVEARVLRFLFDEEGRLHELRGQGADSGKPRRSRREARADRPPRRPDGEASGDSSRGAGEPGRKQARVVLTAEPVGAGPAGTKRAECDRLSARFDPPTGRLEGAQLDGEVRFTEPGRTAWSERAVYDEAAARLTMTGGGPGIRDEEEGSELGAETIVLGTGRSHVSADGGVRHTLARRASGEGLLGGEEPTILVSGRFEYDPDSKTARYHESALLRSGRDEIRAPLIVLEEPAPGERRLSASGGTSSLLHPRPEKGAAEEPAAVETRSREMVYDEKAGRVVYTGDVEIRQGDILTMSPEAVVTLTGDGRAVEKMVAGEPVEVRQGPRRATGRTGTYTPASETLVLVGDEVVLRDEDRQVKGRALTFQVGDDRIRIDGQQEVRTEAVFRTKEPPPP